LLNAFFSTLVEIRMDQTNPCVLSSLYLSTLWDDRQNSAFFSNMSQYLLAHVLKPPGLQHRSREREDAVVGQVLLAIIFQETRDTDTKRGFSELAKAFDSTLLTLSRTGVPLI
jgi:hypothetical protein